MKLISVLVFVNCPKLISIIMTELPVNSFLFWHKACRYTVTAQDNCRVSCVINDCDLTEESAFDFWIIEFFGLLFLWLRVPTVIPQ